ncbi:MAG: GldM family protein [Bacteroidales bacterium]
MKIICLILSSLLIPFIVDAQDAVVSAVKMNVLFRGVSNPVEIAVSGVKSDKVTATITNGTIKKVAKGWEVMPGEQAESIITVSVDNKKVSEKSFRVKNIGTPVAVFAGLTDGIISKDAASKTDALEAKLINSDWDLQFEIVSFSLFCSNATGEIMELSKGSKLTDKMKSIIANCKKGQKIIFKDIKAIDQDGKIRELNPIVLELD